MIGKIIEVLKLDNFYAESEVIDIAKGKYKKVSKFSEVYKQKRRELLSKAYKDGRKEGN